MTTKALVLIGFLVVFAAGYLVARAKYKPQLVELSSMIIEKEQAMKEVEANANKLMMKDETMWVVEEGMAREMDADMMLSSGTKIMQNGRVIRPNGEEVVLKNGEAVDMKGNMMDSSSN